MRDGGQLEESQAGLRLDYAVARNLAVTGRISAPIETRLGREAAIGLSWRPALSIPFTVTREGAGSGRTQRIFRNSRAGIGPVALTADFTLEDHRQAGIVGLQRRDGFVDGAVTAMRSVVQNDGSSLAIGGGVWGAAQPRVSRLEIGPRLRFRLNAPNIGAWLDWRHRASGNATPRSGFAPTLDGSF